MYVLSDLKSVIYKPGAKNNSKGCRDDSEMVWNRRTLREKLFSSLTLSDSAFVIWFHMKYS